MAQPRPVSAEQHNEVLDRAQRRVDRLEGRLADVVRPILERAGSDAARRFRAYATNHLTAAAAANEDVSAAATMVCVRPRPDEAAAIADPDGDPPEILHVTLAFLGDVAGDLRPTVEALHPVAASLAPLEGTVSGYGVFDPAGVGILLPDVRGLVELRVAVCEALLAARLDYDRQHGFQAHLTVHSDPTGDDQAAALERAAGLPLHFDSLYVVRGNAEEHELPLVGVPALTAAGEPPQWTAPFPDEIVDVDALVAELLAKTDPVRLAMVEQTMTPALEQAGLSWDVTNPLAARALASSAAQVRSIAQTTRLNVMRIVGSAYRNGLSIPQTADAIQEGMQAASGPRATMIARTELSRAANGGSLAATQLVSSATGDRYDKTWRTASGALYPRHEDYDGLDGQTVGLDEAFEVGGSEMQYPGDPGGDPGESINCRCAMTYMTPEGEQEADADDPPELDSGDSAGGGGGGGQITLPSAALSAPLGPLGGRDARGLASSMASRAAAIEPALTSSVGATADAAGAKLVGLDYRLKSADSAARKIASDAVDRGKTVRETAYEVSDMVRYTAQLPAERYVAGTRAMLADLQRQGFRVARFRNTWLPDVPYAGVNVQMAAANGYRFELQFHTPESWALKNDVNHALYEEWRLLPVDSPRAVELVNEMAANTARIPQPPGVRELRLGEPASSTEIGVTPFRAGEDPIGFYDSAKYQEFTDRVQTTANDYGVTVGGVDHMTGVWQGETEPSVAIRAHDGELGLRAFAASLGRTYDQDGVLLFGDGGGDVVATFPASAQEDALAALRDAGLDGGRLTADGRLQVIGTDGPEFRAQLEKVAAGLGDPVYERGAFSMLERDSGDYQAALDAFANPAPTVATLVPGASAETLQSAAANADARTAAWAQKNHLTAEEYRAQGLENVKAALADPEVRIRVPSESLSKILEDGRFKSQFETGTSQGALSNEQRAKAEEIMFGYPRDLPVEERPLYAYLAGSSEDGIVNGYGHILVRLDESVNARTTFSLDDSLGAGLHEELAPTPVLDPGLGSWTGRTDLVGDGSSLQDISGWYAEAQVHGGLTVSDVAEVVFSREDEGSAIQSLRNLAASYEKSGHGELAVEYQARADALEQAARDQRAKLDELGIPWREVPSSFVGV